MRATRSALVVISSLYAGCSSAPPVAIDRASVLAQLSTRYSSFYGERSAALVRPRFGAPDFAQREAPFAVELLERRAPRGLRAALALPSLSDEEAAACVARGAPATASCRPLALEQVGHDDEPGGVVHVRLAAVADGAASGGWDLLVAADGDPVTRARRSVWLSDGDPTAPRPLRVAQISDLHVGKEPARLEPRARRVLADINRAAPDLVIVTGDNVEQGLDPGLEPRAAELLATLDAPVLVVMGGHDIGIGASVRESPLYGDGWRHFAASFHPLLLDEVALGGWAFIGFDTGPNSAPGALDRGLSPSSVAAIGGAVASARAAGRDVVLFSHAPSRSSVLDLGRMRYGGAAFEGMMLDAASTGQRVLHLTGHTHWADAFVGDEGGDRRWRRWRRWRIDPAHPTPVGSRAAIITTQSASQAGFPLKKSARGQGWTELHLAVGGPPVVEVHHFD